MTSLYNGVIEEPTDEIISLSWVVGNLNSSGAEVVQDNTLRSDFVSIEDNYDYSFYLDESMADPGGVRVYFYNSDKGFISRTNGHDLGYATGADNPIDIPSGAVYMRFKSSIDGTTTLNNINTLLALRKTKSYIRNGLSLYIDADDVASYGSIRDITGNQTITNNGVSTVLDNGCLNFVANESDYIDTGLVPNLTKWSAELYFYFRSIPANTSSVCAWGVSGNKFRIAYSGTAGYFATQVNGNENRRICDINDILSLRHVIITMNNGVVIAYLDGEKIELTTNETLLTTHTTTIKLGSKYTGESEFANINLKLFRFYDGKVLTDEEVLQNYNYELRRNSSIIKPTWIDEKSLSSGNVVSNVYTMITEPIKIDENYNYTISYTTNVVEVRIVSYDADKTFISRTEYLTSGSTDTLIEFPEGTAYFRIKVKKAGITVDQADDNVILKKVLK